MEKILSKIFSISKIFELDGNFFFVITFTNGLEYLVKSKFIMVTESRHNEFVQLMSNKLEAEIEYDPSTQKMELSLTDRKTV